MFCESIATSYIDDKDTPWVPFLPHDERVELKYFKIDPVRGEQVLMMKIPEGVEMARHHHTGTVIVYTVSGSWKYKEHDWVAKPGSCVYETASSRHTPETLTGVGETLIFAILTGELIYLDDDDNTLATENWRTGMERYLNYCKANGLNPAI